MLCSTVLFYSHKTAEGQKRNDNAGDKHAAGNRNESLFEGHIEKRRNHAAGICARAGKRNSDEKEKSDDLIFCHLFGFFHHFGFKAVDKAGKELGIAKIGTQRTRKEILDRIRLAVCGKR